MQPDGDAMMPHREGGSAAARPPVNPFATRWTRPGRVTARDAIGRPLDVVGLLGRLVELGGSAAVEGPHGSGKTTLLAALAAELARDGRLAAQVRVRSWRDAAALLRIVWGARPAATVCVDSWEAIGVVPGIIVRGLACWRRCGLIVTSHRPTGLPPLWRCETSVELLARIVASLPDDGGRMGIGDIRRSFERHAGNLRESLLDLYDVFEGRRAATVGSRM
jgi:hypothetical protein